MVVRLLRFTWVAGIALALLALVGIVIAAVVIPWHAAQPGGTSSPSTPSTHALGTSAQLGSLQATVSATRIVPFDPSHRPAANHAFVAVPVRLRNTGPTATTYSVSDFVLRDQAEEELEPDVAGSALIGGAALSEHGTLQPGASIAGEVVFQVPMTDHTATLLWRPSTSTTGTTESAASWVLAV